MAKTRRNAYDAAFKLKAIDLAVGKGNRAAARELGLNESMIRRWKQQREELTQCKKTTTKAYCKFFFFVTSRVSLKPIYFCYKPCFVKAYLFLLQAVFR
jgi:thiaminase